MAFVFLVEDGTGLPNATSYVSVEDADDIIAVNIHADSKWSELDVSDKEKLLSWASRFLDSHTRWYGAKSVAASSLRWPRSNVCDRDGGEIPSDAIPRQLMIAVASLATSLIDGDRTAEREQDGLVSIRADVVELVFKEGYRLPKVPSHIKYLIEGLGVITSGRTRFKRIIR